VVLYSAHYLTTSSTPTSSFRFERIRFDVPTPRSGFSFARPSGAVERHFSWGFRPSTAAGLARSVGYTPLLPVDTGGIPLGGLAAAAVTGNRIPLSRLNPPPEVRHHVVSAVYGNGVPGVLVVSNRSYRASEGLPPADDFQDPSVRQINPTPPTTVRLRSGALAGAVASVQSSLVDNTVLWAAKDGVLVRIIASLPPETVVAIANSLAPVRS
jgi:hypothetical protein